jgi:dienelactone hydrolase
MRLLTLLAVLLLTGAWGGVEMSIPPQPLAGTRAAPQPLPARLYLPDGKGPFPALVVMHTCAGLGGGTALGGTSLIDQWIGRLNGWGYAALVPDSFSPRGVSSVCAPQDQPKVTTFDRTGDAVSAALALRTRPEIDGKRIAVIGFSHGGATAARVAIAPAATAVPGLIRAAIDYYGGCANPERYTGMPFLVLAGDADTWGNPARTCTRFGERIGAGHPFELATYPGVVHSFDNQSAQRLVESFGHPLQYDYAAATDSFARVKAFLERYDR